MAEIIKVYRQPIPAMRFIGKNYGNSENTDWGANWSDAFVSDIFGKVERVSGDENESHLLYKDNDAYIGLCYRNEETGVYDAWIEMFAPVGTGVDIGLDYILIFHSKILVYVGFMAKKMKCIVWFLSVQKN